MANSDSRKDEDRNDRVCCRVPVEEFPHADIEGKLVARFDLLQAASLVADRIPEQTATWI
jgi:hypothetical protein